MAREEEIVSAAFKRDILGYRSVSHSDVMKCLFGVRPLRERGVSEWEAAVSLFQEYSLRLLISA